jgi:hypothetical protein
MQEVTFRPSINQKPNILKKQVKEYIPKKPVKDSYLK